MILDQSAGTAVPVRKGMVPDDVETGQQRPGQPPTKGKRIVSLDLEVRANEPVTQSLQKVLALKVVDTTEQASCS